MEIAAGIVAFVVGGLWLWRAVSPETAWWPSSQQDASNTSTRSRIQAGVAAAVFLAAGVVWMVVAGR